MAFTKVENAGILGGFGLSIGIEMTEGTDGKMTPGSMKFWTGANNARKALLTASSMPVADEGTLTATINTTMKGLSLSAFRQEYLSMYYAPTETRSASQAPELVDEAGRGSGETGIAVPTNKMILWLFFGGDFIGIQDADVSEPGNKIKELQFALVSVANSTAGNAFAYNTYNDVTISLVGQYPKNDIELILNTALIQEAAAQAGFEIVGGANILLPKDVQTDTMQIEVKYV